MQAVQIYAKFDYEVELMKVGHGHGYIRLNYSAYGVFSYSNLLTKSLQCGLLSLVCFLICLPFVITWNSMTVNLKPINFADLLFFHSTLFLNQFSASFASIGIHS